MGGQLRPGLLSRVAGQSSPKVIVAYHGSPHSFDRFDAARMGTGFGAADFAVGHNFASLPEVAEYYRKTLPGNGSVYEVAIDSDPASLLDYERILSGDPGRRAIAALRSTSPEWISGGDLRRLESGLSIDPMQEWAVAQTLRGMARSPDGAAAMLEHGIPGMSHADPTRIGRGTRNYVMFPGTEDRIRILRQYGLLPPLAGGLALQEEE